MNRKFLASALLLILFAAAEPSEKAFAGEGNDGFLYPLAKKKTADKVVAVIDQQPILLSELDIEARIVLISQGGTMAAASIQLGDDVLRDMLTQVINLRLAEREANRLQASILTADDSQKAYLAFVQIIGGEIPLQQFLRHHDLSEQRLVTILDRIMRTEKFLADKMVVSAKVTDADAKEFYDSNADAFGGKPFPTVRKSIINSLLHQKLKEETAKFFTSLRSRCEIRILPPFIEDSSAYTAAPKIKMVKIELQRTEQDEDAGTPSEGD